MLKYFHTNIKSYLTYMRDLWYNIFEFCFILFYAKKKFLIIKQFINIVLENILKVHSLKY